MRRKRQEIIIVCFKFYDLERCQEFVCLQVREQSQGIIDRTVCKLPRERSNQTLLRKEL